MSFHCCRGLAKFLPQGTQSGVNPFLTELHATFVGLLDYIFPTCQFWIFFYRDFTLVSVPLLETFNQNTQGKDQLDTKIVFYLDFKLV